MEYDKFRDHISGIGMERKQHHWGPRYESTGRSQAAASIKHLIGKGYVLIQQDGKRGDASVVMLYSKEYFAKSGRKRYGFMVMVRFNKANDIQPDKWQISTRYEERPLKTYANTCGKNNTSIKVGTRYASYM